MRGLNAPLLSHILGIAGLAICSVWSILEGRDFFIYGRQKKEEGGFIQRRGHHRPRGIGGGTEEAGDVHRHDRHVGLASSCLGSIRQFARRGDGWFCKRHRSGAPSRRLGARRRQWSRHSSRRPFENKSLRARNGNDKIARRWQIRW